jgi:hypothetical protein
VDPVYGTVSGLQAQQLISICRPTYTDLYPSLSALGTNHQVNGEGEVDKFCALAMLSAVAHKRSKASREKDAGEQGGW